VSKRRLPTSSTTVKTTSPPPTFLFFGGKGGVGKTTCAAASAVAAARRGKQVLAVSTDPAHSLGDALGSRLSARVSNITLKGGGAVLRAVELDASRAFVRWLGDHRHALADIIEHGTWLDHADVDAIMGLSIPGIDELIGLVEIARLASLRPYDLIVIDTAPTGHTLRLLAAPQAVAAVAAALSDLQHQHRLIRERFARVAKPEAADRLIALLTQQAAATGQLLQDPSRSAFHWVMLPEELSLAESRDGLRSLEAAHIPVPAIIVNRVIADGAACPICDRRRAAEGRVLATVRRTIGRRRTVVVVTDGTREPRGEAALEQIGLRLSSKAGSKARLASAGGRSARGAGSLAFSVRRPDGEALQDLVDRFQDARLVFFGGKGGVGKSTAAAAFAVRLARAQTARRVLLISTDPAHSLGDVFGADVGDVPAPLRRGPPNLHVRELDAPHALAAKRAALSEALDEIVTAFGASALATPGGGAEELMDLAPPGVDELFGLVSLFAAPRDQTYDVFIVDTAPTGHALRLLELPDAAREWVQVLMRVLLKYRELVRPGRLAAELLELSQSIRALRALLQDAVLARFVVVTRAAAVPRLETERLAGRLRQLHLAVSCVMVNAMTLAPGRCPRCRRTAAAEKIELALLGRVCRLASPNCVIIQAPLAAPPPRGVAALDKWGSTWINHTNGR
jgi:arsenite-transporting ATPase